MRPGRRIYVETTVYDRLADLQGSCVPQLYHKVTFDPLNLPPSPSEVFMVPGILIEFIEGFNLHMLALYAPQTYWQSLLDQAVKVINLIGDYSVINQDVRTENMIMRKKAEHFEENGNVKKLPILKLGDDYDIFAIDFGLSRLRRYSETDDEWKRAKCKQHEDRNISLNLRNDIRRSHGVELKWRSTRRFDSPWVLERLGSDYTYEEYVVNDL